MTGALDGIGVVVTRPEHQAGPFARRVEQAGGRALRLPVVAIESLLDRPEAGRALDDAGDADLLVFTSRNAVDLAAPFLQHHRAPGPRTRVAAIGAATARALRRHGLPVHVEPATGASSETLLQALGGSVSAGGTAVLLRGEGGRDVLARALAGHGMEVTDLACYRRVAGPASGAQLRAWLRDGLVDAVTVTSVEILERLLALTAEDDIERLRAVAVVAGGDRIAGACRAAGWSEPVVARDPTDDAMLAALVAWRAKARNDCGTLQKKSSSPARTRHSQDGNQ